MKKSILFKRNRGLRNSLLFFSLFFSLCITAAVKISVSNGNWSTASNWFPSGVPGANDKIYIFHSITLDQNFTVSDTVFVYGVLNFGSGKVLTLNPGMMVLVNTAMYDGKIGTMGSNATISGSYIFKKWITRCDGYSTYGSPFDVPASDFDWYYCYQCLPSWSNLYYYDETQSGSMDNGYYDNIGGQIARGKGFFYWYSNYTGGQNFPRQIALKGSTNFANTFDFGVTYTSGNGILNDGHNLLSNPFPGTIDWLSGGWSKSKVNNALYTWNGCSGLYASYVAGVGVNGGSRYISSMQGFWVQTNSSNPNLKVSSSALVNVSQSLLRQADTGTPENILRLSLDDDEIAVRMDTASTFGFDSETDALKFFSENSRICSGTGSDTLDFAINAIPGGTRVIPVKVKGGGTLTITGATTFSGYALYIKDVNTGISQLLDENFRYIFTDTSLVSFNTRFELFFREMNVSGIKQEQKGSALIKTGDQLLTIVPQGFSSPVFVTVCDLLGRQLYNGVFGQQEIDLPRWNQPVILRISDQSRCFVKKVF